MTRADRVSTYDGFHIGAHKGPFNTRFPPDGWSSLEHYPATEIIAMLQRMRLIREFESRVNDLFLAGHVPGTIHLSFGQEATVVGVCSALGNADWITMTHRAHGQALAKGVAPGPLLAEILGRVAGSCRGMGGSMHVGDLSVGAFPAIAIVAAGIPIATGFAFAARQRRTEEVAVAFFGDGAINKGELHEAMNLAALWNLPIVFVCENNVYASTTHISEFVLNETLAERAAAYRMSAEVIDGNDLIAVRAAAERAVSSARNGGGPTFIECLTYRRGGHKRDDPGRYRDDREVSAWLARDPIASLEERLLESGVLSGEDVDRLRAETAREIDAATDEALGSPDPDRSQILEFVYA